ncbi:YoaK family protein [soil metagenome]
MTHYDRSARLLAIALATQAGFVDALGFLELGGYFVSFMSGNSTRIAVDAAGHGDAVARVGAIVAWFFAGVVFGSCVRRAFAVTPMTAVLIFVLASLVLAAAVQADASMVAIFAMTMAMGAVNATFERQGSAGLGVTYVTGAMVKSGQLLVGALCGGDRTAWLWQVLLWMGLVLGALLGGLAYTRWQLGSLWIACSACLILVLCTRVFEKRMPARAWPAAVDGGSVDARRRPD